MPNWCSNNIEISGSKDAIKEIANVLDNARENDLFVFASLIGIKPGVSKEDYEKDKWYQANVDYYGTKWDVSYGDCAIEVTDNYITMSPDTAWSPPINFCEELAKKYQVDVEIEYSEAGCDFCGKAIINSQGVIKDTCYKYEEGKYHLDIDYFWNSVVDYAIDQYLEDKEKPVKEWVNERFYFIEDADDKQQIIEDILSNW